MRLIYNILFTIFFLLAAPFYFLKMWRRGNWSQGFGQRFGRFSLHIMQIITNRHVIWFHAVSVGEVNLCTQLIAALEPRIPNLKIVVSTTTSTGMAELHKKLPSHILKVYYPIDRASCVRRTFTKFHIVAVVLIEAEIWPNFLWQLKDRGIPAFLVNARLSDKSLRGYKRFGFLFRPLFASFAGVGVQNAEDAERVKQVGCRPSAVHVVGNLKFDAAKLEERHPLNVGSMLRQLHVATDSLVIVAGSTHVGEEALLAEQYLRLKKKHPKLFLVLVPRHFERAKDVAKELQSRGLKFKLRSDIVNSRDFKDDIDCLLVNSTGELKYFYEHATVIFVGKSLTAEGGQNPIEPGILGKAMVFGPNMQNFAAIAKAFVSKGGAVQVRNAAELETTFDELLGNEERRTELGRNALEVVRENRGGIDRTVDMIVAKLDREDLYKAPRA